MKMDNKMNEYHMRGSDFHVCYDRFSALFRTSCRYFASVQIYIMTLLTNA